MKPTLARLEALAAQVQDAESALDSARRERDTALRDLRRQGYTVPQLATAGRVSPATIKAVVRGITPGSTTPAD